MDKSHFPVQVFAPASACPVEELEAAKQFLQKKGFQVSCPIDLFQERHPFLAAPLKSRENFFLSAVKKNSVEKSLGFLWAARGGYGSLQLVPFLIQNKQKLRSLVLRNKKLKSLLIGLSDITVIHHFFHQVLGVATVHGGILARYGSPRASSEEANEICHLLKGFVSEVQFKNLKPVNKAAKEFLQQGKKLKSEIIGGNLITYESLLGTSLQPRLKNKILFLEEIEERGYKVHRSLTHLKLAGVFEKQKAVLLGDFLGGNEPVNHEGHSKNFVQRALTEFFETLPIPVFSGVTTGHGELQRPLPMFTSAKIESQPNTAVLTVQNPAFVSKKEKTPVVRKGRRS